MGLNVKISYDKGFIFCSFMFQVEHLNYETVSFLNGPIFIQITNE